MAGSSGGYLTSKNTKTGVKGFVSLAVRQKYGFSMAQIQNLSPQMQQKLINESVQPTGQAKAAQPPALVPMPSTFPFAAGAATVGFNPNAERDVVMEWNGVTAVRKPGMTYDQTKRFYARRDAALAADKLKAQGGVSIRQDLDSLLGDGSDWTITGKLSGGRIRLIRTSDDSELILKNNVAKDYAMTVLNYGPLARNY